MAANVPYKRYKIVETDNYGGDYPNEKFVNLPSTTKNHAKAIAKAINDGFHKYDDGPRYWKVVESNYELQPGFQP